LVDPLDATKEYTLGNLPAVCCLIGIAVKGEAVGMKKRKKEKKHNEN